MNSFDGRTAGKVSLLAYFAGICGFGLFGGFVMV
jgi:hypothetical protein